MQHDAEDAHDLTSLRPLIGTAVAVLLLWIIAGTLIIDAFPSWPERGQFGDMFGAVNSLFSGLAFAGVIFTIYLQRQELALQRRELELTRTQLARSADAQEKSEQALARQVEALQRTARLSALSSVIEHYNIKINRTGVASESLALRKRQLEYVAQLEEELGKLSDLEKD